MSSKQKVCLVYTRDDEEKRTRFFKPTSTHVIKREQKALEEKGYSPEIVTRNKWEASHGEINKPRSPLVTPVDLSMISKTEQMRANDHKGRQRRRNKRN